VIGLQCLVMEGLEDEKYDIPVLLVAQRRIEGRLDTASGHDDSLLFLHDTMTRHYTLRLLVTCRSAFGYLLMCRATTAFSSTIRVEKQWFP
jgi:hypothetical protein